METLGTYLRREREFRKISIQDIAVDTRVSISCIEALENDALAELPAVTFVRGYLKAYAEHVGLDVADVLLRYEQSLDRDSEAVTNGAHKSQGSWHWKWKHLWITLLFGTIVALAAYLSQL